MSIRVAFIAVVAAVSAAAAAAQPDKDQQRPKAPQQPARTPVVLASASDLRQPTTAPTSPVRRPAPRVTTCRCGDPQVPQDQSPEEQPDR